MIKWLNFLLIVCVMTVGVFPVSADDTININSATAAELDRALDGVGEVKSKAIVEYREKHGPFKKPEDIRLVNGIGKKTFEKNAERIRVSAPAPATPKQSSSDGTQASPQAQAPTDSGTGDGEANKSSSAAPTSEAVR